MKKQFIAFLLLLPLSGVFAQHKAEWVYTTKDVQWKEQPGLTFFTSDVLPDAEILLTEPQQTILGFGSCFNELGWTSLSKLSPVQREEIMKELFAPHVGANFTICRMPVGANDFSRKWYSYDETDGDFEMSHFSIANDEENLIPFIKNALKYNPSLKLWASPWSPPSWMKYNRHYAAKSILGNSGFTSDDYGMDMKGINNGLDPAKEGKEGTDMFIQEEKYFKAYALYFARFIESYRKENINIQMVMPQNEFNSAQIFPSCTWTARGLEKFLSYLGPVMTGLKVDLFFGTMERPDHRLADSVLNDPLCGKFIKGVGFQWAGKGAIEQIHKTHPSLILYQSEQECGNGKNDWAYCQYAWSLMKHYLNNGANAYMYWNTSLTRNELSTWGWRQNSLISVDPDKKSFSYNYEYYLMKHLSHFVMPSAKKLATGGAFQNLLAFVNPDKSVVVVIQNDSDREKNMTIRIGNTYIKPVLKADSFNTILVK